MAFEQPIEESFDPVSTCPPERGYSPEEEPERSEPLRPGGRGRTFDTEYVLERAREGQDEAWREILEQYHDMLLFHVRSTIRRPFVDHEDLLQTAFEKAWANLDKFEYRGEGSFRAWLASLVVNIARNESRRLEIESRTRAASDAVLEHVEDEGAARRKEEGDLLQDLLAKLGKLDTEDRDLVIMKTFQGYPWERIAVIMECSPDTARNRYARALRRLQRGMGEGGE